MKYLYHEPKYFSVSSVNSVVFFASHKISPSNPVNLTINSNQLPYRYLKPSPCIHRLAFIIPLSRKHDRPRPPHSLDIFFCIAPVFRFKVARIQFILQPRYYQLLIFPDTSISILKLASPARRRRFRRGVWGLPQRRS